MPQIDAQLKKEIHDFHCMLSSLNTVKKEAIKLLQNSDNEKICVVSGAIAHIISNIIEATTLSIQADGLHCIIDYTYVSTLLLQAYHPEDQRLTEVQEIYELRKSSDYVDLGTL